MQIESVLHTGISETILLTLLVLVLSINELLSGVEGQAIARLRLVMRVSTIPLLGLFVLLAVARIAHLV